MNQENRHRVNYRAAVRVIEAQRKLLAEASADPQILEGLTAIVRHLYRLPDQNIDRLFGFRDTTKARDREKQIKEASQFSIEEIERKIASDDSTRGELEAIAIGRFHVPKGSMRSLGNLDRLKEKLTTFVQNEKTHATITELARNNR